MISQAQTRPRSDELLDICDGVLGEVGRRSHLFAWLRSDDGAAGEWLAVDAYYPRHRLVVVCHEGPGEPNPLYIELVPKHGLRLLALTPAQLGPDRQAAIEAIRELIAELVQEPPPRVDTEVETRTPSEPRRVRGASILQAAAALAQPAPPAPREAQIVRPSQAAAVARASRFAAASGGARRAQPAGHPLVAPAPRRTPSPPRRLPARVQSEGPDVEALGLFLGLSLVALLLVEMYLDVSKVALGGGEILLAFGIAIDAVARTLGTIAAHRAGRAGWAWACALGGSPVVMAFTLFGSEGPVATDPAPLAGLLSLLASGSIVIALLGAVLGF